MASSTVLQALGSVTLVSLLSFLGALYLFVDEKFLRKSLLVLVSLGVGGLLGDAFLHLLPESYADKKNHELTVSLLVLAGILLFFIQEKILKWRHLDLGAEGHVHPVGYMNLAATGMHNFVDGVLIGASFLAGPRIGIATTLAVILHEIPHEISDFGVLVHAGFKPKKALWLNFLSALTAIAGALSALWVGTWAAAFVPALLPFAAGGFIYIAACDLVPELHKENSLWGSMGQLAGISVGIVSMILLRLLE
ncbi:MAG TPA: ZIP family metal transporter [bacterium]|nr:ZIP family metal transporter [bacterium]